MVDKTDDLVIGISTDLTTIKRQLRQLGQTITQETSGYGKSFEAFGRRMDAAVKTTGVQDRINKMTGAATKSTKEWTGALADQAREFDAIRAKYSPLFAAQQQYLANLKDIRTAQAIGALSTGEAAAAITRQKAAFASSVVAINNGNKALKGTGAVAKLTSNQMLNLSRQGNDVITMFALGANPMQIFASQAGQIYDALEQGPGGIGGSLKAIGASILGFITPAGLAATAIAGLGAAFVAYELSGTKGLESLDVILKRHAENIKLLGDAYEEVTTKQKKLAVISPDAFNFLNEGDTKKLQDKLKASISSIFAGATENQLSSSMGALTTETVVKSFFEPFSKAIQDLENSAKDTTALQRFVDTVIQFARANPQYTDAATALLDLAQSTKKGSKVISDGAFDVAAALQQATKPVDDFAAVVNQFNDKMNSVTSQPLQDALQGIFDKAKDGKSSVDDINNAIAALEQANPSFSGIIDAIGQIILQARGASQAVADIYANTGGGSPNGRHVNPIEIATEKAIQDAQYRGAQFMPTPAPNREDLGRAYDKALAKANKHHAPRRTAAGRFAEDIKSIQARTTALAQERGLLGATYEEQIKRNTAFDIEQKALKEVREEARRKGDQDWQNAQLSENQKKKIDEVSDAYARQADALKKATDEMNFERDVLKGVFDDIRSALADGKISAKEWGDIFMGVLDKIIDKIENDLIDSILQASHAVGGSGLFGWLFGATGGGGGLSSIALKAVASGLGGLYADGGYTGAGSKNQPAGVVHRGEVVWSQADIARAGGVGVVEALRRGVQMPNIAARRGADTAVHVTVGVAADGNGNLMPFVQSVAQTAAAQSTASLARRVPKMVDARNKTKQLRGTRA